ncbi:uncharacterized protein Bfra_004668 [Botrytis fragariae]|uniref:Uncharacterized protein n=1 Tax=Botrytis fragariae TaxID=1964551 RepID=A0A8H6AWA6_9HELO|nr:uncharacterized protein Bfra_004668 [Botrytis fragariae]KAF5874655.1 hypothetical protein Bfra_004668 [Botrytis fragariae]
MVEPPFIQLSVEGKGDIPEWNGNTTKVSANPDKTFTAITEVKQKFQTVQGIASHMRIVQTSILWQVDHNVEVNDIIGNSVWILLYCWKRDVLSHHRVAVAKAQRPTQHANLQHGSLSALSGFDERSVDTLLCCLIPSLMNMNL